MEGCQVDGVVGGDGRVCGVFGRGDGVWVARVGEVCGEVGWASGRVVYGMGLKLSMMGGRIRTGKKVRSIYDGFWGGHLALWVRSFLLQAMCRYMLFGLASLSSNKTLSHQFLINFPILFFI